jgi:hypothetical protein
MEIKNKQPARPVQLKPWSEPVLRRMNAGSAELNVSGASDGPNQVS